MNVTTNISLANTTRILKFDRILSTSGNVVIGIVLTLTTIFGAVENFAAIFIFYKRKILRRPTNYFVIALSVLNFLMSTIAIPMAAISSFVQTWVFGRAGCIYYGFIMTWFGLAIISTLVVISIDRYIVIVKPCYKMNKKIALISMAGYLTLSFIMSFVPLIGWSSYTLEGAGTSCSINWNSNAPKDVSVSITYLIFYFCVPLGIILFSYISIFIKVRKDTLSPRQGNVFRSSTGRNSHVECEVAKFMFSTVCAFILSWLPYTVVSAWATFGNPSDIPTSVAVVPAIMAKVSVVWNPIIYVLKNRNFRSAIILYCPRLNRYLCTGDLRIASHIEPEFTQRPDEEPFPSGSRQVKPAFLDNSKTGLEKTGNDKAVEMDQICQTSTESISVYQIQTQTSSLDHAIGGVWLGQESESL